MSAALDRLSADVSAFEVRHGVSQPGNTAAFLNRLRASGMQVEDPGTLAWLFWRLAGLARDKALSDPG